MPRKPLFTALILLFAFLTHNYAYCDGIKKRKIKKLFKRSAVFKSHFTGFELYDMDQHKTVFELNGDKYFTPASNTKLFTFYAGLNMIGDSVPAIRYVMRGDSLLFWGTGDPSLLHPDLKGTNGFNLLKNNDKHIYYCGGLYQNPQLGAGWAWDDYNDYYQAEINELPLYGNTVYVYADAAGQLQTMPGYFKPYLKADSGYHPTKFKVQRSLTGNQLTYPAMPVPAGFKQWIPFQTSETLTTALLADTLHKTVSLLMNKPLPPDAKTIYNSNADTVYRHMLQPSDNFIAEQLLLSCSSVKYGYLNTDSVRGYAVSHLLDSLPDKPQWNDGSGLTRLNLFTPRSMVVLLNLINEKVNNDELLHSMLPVGGVSGTIRNAYKTDNGVPFVWAKTGSLSNNYNQSGYLVTRKGRRLCFSFMNNNFTETSATVRNEMVRIITYIHEKF